MPAAEQQWIDQVSCATHSCSCLSLPSLAARFSEHLPIFIALHILLLHITPTPAAASTMQQQQVLSRLRTLSYCSSTAPIVTPQPHHHYHIPSIIFSSMDISTASCSSAPASHTTQVTLPHSASSNRGTRTAPTRQCRQQPGRHHNHS
jgi:hypothetical protein